jgi:hypothetical protein
MSVGSSKRPLFIIKVSGFALLFEKSRFRAKISSDYLADHSLFSQMIDVTSLNKNGSLGLPVFTLIPYGR